MKPLKRTEYRVPPITGKPTDTTRLCSTMRTESQVDQVDYLDPLHQAHGAGLHTWGVAEGLEVSAVINSSGVLVKPGTALDAAGRTIVLAPKGGAVIAPDADPNELENIETVEVPATGINLPTANLSGEYALTIQFREKYEAPVGGFPQMLHTPWLRLQDAPPIEGWELILAQVTIENGNVTKLEEKKRRLAGLPAGTLTLYRPRNTNSSSIGQTAAAVLRPRDDGGLEIRASQTGSSTPWLVIEGGTGHVGIGTGEPEQSLHVAGGLKITDDADLQGKLAVAGHVDLTKGLKVVGDANLQSLTVESNIGVNGTVDGRDVSEDGNKLDAHVADTSLHGAVTQLAKYLPLAGGTMTGSLTVGGDIGVKGTVDGRRVSADGSKLDAHVADTNLHGAVTQLAKYLPLAGGTMTGSLMVSGNVGIGTTNPQARLSLGNAVKQALLIHQNDGANVRAGFGIDMGSGGRELDIFFPGGGQGGHLSIGTVSEDGKYTYSEKIRVTENGSVGIGTSTPAAKLDVNGDLKVASDVTVGRWFVIDGPDLVLRGRRAERPRTNVASRALVDFGIEGLHLNFDNDFGKVIIGGTFYGKHGGSGSDLRLKTNIVPLVSVIDKIGQIRPVSFDWTEEASRLHGSSGQRELGVIAQEVEAEFPELVTQYDSRGYKAVNYNQLTVVLLAAIQELKASLDAVRTRA